MLVVNGMLSKSSSADVVDRLKRITREFSDLHNEDARLPLARALGDDAARGACATGSWQRSRSCAAAAAHARLKVSP